MGEAEARSSAGIALRRQQPEKSASNSAAAKQRAVRCRVHAAAVTLSLERNFTFTRNAPGTWFPTLSSFAFSCPFPSPCCAHAQAESDCISSMQSETTFPDRSTRCTVCWHKYTPAFFSILVPNFSLVFRPDLTGILFLVPLPPLLHYDTRGFRCSQRVHCVRACIDPNSYHAHAVLLIRSLADFVSLLSEDCLIIILLTCLAPHYNNLASLIYCCLPALRRHCSAR